MKAFLLVCLLLAVLLAAPGGARADPPAPGVWPLQPQPEVVHPFDPPDSPWGAGHRGVDLLGRPGQEVHAALAGTVTFAGTLAGRGVVVVDHGGTRTTYEPVDPGVALGTSVGTGQVLGHLQACLSHCFPLACLHWGLLRGEQYLDPQSLLGRAPVRLLPLTAVERAPVTPVARAAWRPAPMLVLPMFRPGGAPAGRPSAAAPP
jgi:murein DD-endopeptidase MepM/ murein hydrolase activator NlpD